MKLFAYSIRPFDEEPYLKEVCEKYGVEYAYTSETPCLENAHLAEGYDAIDIITTPFPKEMIDEFYRLGVRCIATRTIGYDHIDYEYARSIGMGVVNITYSPDTVADFTVMMMLMGLRKIKHIQQRAVIQDFSLKGKLAREIGNCVVGVIGTGRIGKRVIKDLSGFGCSIIAYDPHPSDEVRQYAEYVELDELISRSDIITLHAPGINENYHMLGHDAFARMKDGVGIVNCARGMLIDSDALIDNIENGKVGFACLDVVEHEDGLYYFNRMGEPLNNPRLAILNSYHNVIVTPHMAFYTEEAVSDMIENSVLGIRDFFEK